MTADDVRRAHRRDLLASLARTRSLFLKLGNAEHAAHLERGILLLLDHRGSDDMLNRMSLGAAIAARAAACLEHVLRVKQSRASAG